MDSKVPVTITLKALAEELGIPYGRVLKAAHAVGIDTPRGSIPRQLAPNERREIEIYLGVKMGS